MRIRNWMSYVVSSDLFTQGDAHIFCREDQIVEEVQAFCKLADRIYRDMGFDGYAIKLALRPDKRFGSDEMWDQAEAELRDAVVRAGLATEDYGWEELPGRSEEHTSELQTLMRISYAVFCLKTKHQTTELRTTPHDKTTVVIEANQYD